MVHARFALVFLWNFHWAVCPRERTFRAAFIAGSCIFLELPIFLKGVSKTWCGACPTKACPTQVFINRSPAGLRQAGLDGGLGALGGRGFGC